MTLIKETIIDIPINNIIPNKINPNKMPSKTFEKLKVSLKKFGQLNPLIVRVLGDKYEIIDGEWRWRASQELGKVTLSAKVIEATDEEVGQLILATTIKGKHDLYEVDEIISKLVGEDKDTLLACNLDKAKIERKTKYHGSDKIKIVAKKGSRDEKDSSNVKQIEEYQRLLLFTFNKKEYDFVITKLSKINKNLEKALLIILEKYE